MKIIHSYFMSYYKKLEKMLFQIIWLRISNNLNYVMFMFVLYGVSLGCKPAQDEIYSTKLELNRLSDSWKWSGISFTFLLVLQN